MLKKQHIIFLSKNNIKIFIFFSLFSVLCFSCENPFITSVLSPRTVTFNSNGGSEVPSQILYKGEKVTIPENPRRAERYFDGWYTDNNSFDKQWDFSVSPDGNMTLYAKWEDGGLLLDPVIIDFGEVFLGYFEIEPQTILIINSASRSTGILTIELTGDNEDSFELSANNIQNIDSGSSETFTVKPKDILKPGTHLASVKVTGSNNIHAITDLQFLVKPSHGISFRGESTIKDLGFVVYGNYSSISHTIEIQNIGNYPTGQLSITLSGPDAGSFTLSTQSINNIIVGEPVGFQITPKADLNAGTYNAVITVTGENDIHASLNILFTVDKQEPVVLWPEIFNAVYGQTLSSLALPGSNDGTPGSFSWTAGSTMQVGNAGNRVHNLTFTPYNLNFKTVYRDVMVYVSKANPNITNWPGPITAIFGNFLWDVAIPTNGASNTFGSFSWENPGETVGIVGNRAFKMLFIPNDLLNFNVMENNINVNVLPRPIEEISISVSIPVIGNNPGVPVVFGPNFWRIRINSFRWAAGAEELANNARFQGSTEYTIQIEVNADDYHIFSRPGGGIITNVKVNEQDAVITNIGSGNTVVSLQFTFPATAPRVVTGISVLRQPDELQYQHGDPLVLTGLAVRLYFNDDTEDDVEAADFGENNLTTVPASGSQIILGYDNSPITIWYNHNTITHNAITDLLEVTRANGAQVSARPTASSVQMINSYVILGVRAVSFVSNPGQQDAEYAVSMEENPDPLYINWQDGTIFTRLIPGVDYYIHARSMANNYYNSGTTATSFPIVFYTMTFFGNGPVGYPTSGSVPATMVSFEGGFVTIPNPGFLTCPGFEFESWNTLPNGSGDRYEKGDWFAFNDNISLYAQWRKL